MYFVHSFQNPHPLPLKFRPEIGLHFSMTRISNLCYGDQKNQHGTAEPEKIPVPKQFRKMFKKIAQLRKTAQFQDVFKNYSITVILINTETFFSWICGSKSSDI